MAKQVKLAAQARSGIGRQEVRKIKQNGMVPAVIYGVKQEPQSLQVAAKDINNLLSHAVGEHVLVDLEIRGESSASTTMAIIQEVQHHPVGGHVLHVDFHAVSADEAIHAEIPIEALGEATGVKNFGGTLDQNIRSLEVQCLPADLPEIIEVDVSALNIGDQITVADLKLPQGVTAGNDADQVIFVVSPPRVEEEEPVAAEAVTTPEVIREKKETPESAEK